MKEQSITPRIRFVDTAYHEIFTLPDNASIVVTHFDGSTVTHPCTYIDDTHAKIGSSVYHLLEFAGLMERNGNIYAPEGGVADYYEVYQADLHSDYCFREYEEAKAVSPWPTTPASMPGCLQGHQPRNSFRPS